MGVSFEERQKEACVRANKELGTLTGYDCADCLNKGGIYEVRNGDMVFKSCHCAEIRKSLKRIEKSGLADMLNECTFDSFGAEESWQKNLKQNAMNFINDYVGKWFFAGGQVGAGKTHICTAIVGEFLKMGKSARYMLWRDEVVRLKASVMDDYEYRKLIDPLKAVDVLYIDDLFKTARAENEIAKKPTPADIGVAFEILNYRYINRNLITIISCEHYIDALTDIDEAVGSRIYQRTKEYCNVIGRDKKRNYRML